jgi:hypothetical protein
MHETLTLPAHIQIEYTRVSNREWEKMDAEDFIDMISDPGFLGDPLLKTQHLLGATERVKVSDTDIIGHHQLRVAHLRYAAPDSRWRIRGDIVTLRMNTTVTKWMGSGSSQG